MKEPKAEGVCDNCGWKGSGKNGKCTNCLKGNIVVDLREFFGVIDE